MHWPFWQPLGHVAPQAPQFSGSTCTSTQPLLHMVWPDGHEPGPHRPPVHVSDGGHAEPQAPQFAMSEVRSTHALPHVVSGGVHCVAQPVAAQTCAGLHAAPQLPQCAGSRRSASHPLRGSPSQSP
jgi:hypothetical protein